MTTTRLERDPLGEKPVPADALYGIQTLRAAENFPISGLRPLPAFVDAVVWIKRSAALTHKETGRLEARLADAIVKAADEVLGGQHRDQFIVDVYQAGAGTSHNMNVNEVLANRANEILGAPRGAYAPVHPNDHVNMAQSTNDVIPTAMRLAVLATLPSTLGRARRRWRRRSWPRAPSSTTSSSRAARICRTRRRSGSARSSRPTATRSQRHRQKLAQAADWLREMDIGGTAVGTGINAEREYPALMVKHLRQVSGLELREGQDRDPAHADHGRRRHPERRVPGLRAGSQQDRQRHPAAGLGAAHRPGRDPAAGGAAGLEHHAGEGESVDRRDGEPGLLPGARPRHHGGDGGRGRASSSSTS